MSSDEARSREALKPEDFTNRPRTNYDKWVMDNILDLFNSSEETQDAARKKWEKFYISVPYPVDIFTDAKAAGYNDEEALNEARGEKLKKVESPSIIKSLKQGPPIIPPQSQDIEYLTAAEILVNEEFNTLNTMKVEDPGSTSGLSIERCVGRNPDTGKLRVVKIPASEVNIKSFQVMQYLGTVVQDHQAVHTVTVVVHGRRWGYSFDRFYYHNGEKLQRCCLVLDPIHQAGIIYKKVVSKKTRKAFPVVKMVPPTNSVPMYRVIGQKETYYRDLKRLYERHYLQRGDEELAEDIGLKNLAGMA